jgi:hypothetical protein
MLREAFFAKSHVVVALQCILGRERVDLRHPRALITFADSSQMFLILNFDLVERLNAYQAVCWNLRAAKELGKDGDLQVVSVEAADEDLSDFEWLGGVGYAHIRHVEFVDEKIGRTEFCIEVFAGHNFFVTQL